MKPEKAIGLLKHHISTWKGKFPSPHFEACEVAIEALEKQIPKELNRFAEGDYLCPECGSGYYLLGDCDDFPDKHKYCSYCGQRLDWSEII